MEVIYDAAKAKNDATFYRKKERNRRIFGVVSLVIHIIGWLIILLTPKDVIALEWVVYCGVGLAFGSFVPATYFATNETKPSIAAKYYMAAEGKTVREVKIEERAGYFNTYQAVCLVTEDADGVIESTELCKVEYKESTKVQEQIFDVNKGVVLVPYTK